MKLTTAEYETHINIDVDDRITLHVASSDPYWIWKLDKIAKATKFTKAAKFYEFDLSDYTFIIRKKPTRTAKQIALAKVLGRVAHKLSELSRN